VAPSTPGGHPIVAVRGVTRRFGNLVANDSIDLDLRAGTVHAVLGQNGAGKSTLMNILAGIIQPDDGEILVDGVPTVFRGASDAFAAGIGMVHQHFQLVASMTVAENLLLNDEPVRRGLVDRARARAMATDALAAIGATVSPDSLVSSLSVASRQRVEIARVLRRASRVVVLDEPTAVLAPTDAKDLMRLVREMADCGTAVVLISHKLDEVLEVADRLTILRAGRVVADQPARGLNSIALANLMVGRAVEMTTNEATRRPAGVPIMCLRGVSTAPAAAGPALCEATIDLLAGQVHGIAGVDGNGQQALVGVLTGSLAPSAGSVTWQGADVHKHGVRKYIEMGVAHIPEDRHDQGLFLEEDLATNLAARRFQSSSESRWGIVNRRRMAARAAKAIAEFEIRGKAEQRARELSGGNQQKVVVARELGSQAHLVVAEQPTRGVDVASAQFIYDQLLQQRDDQRAVVVVSVDLDELLLLCDTISVMYGGRVAGTWQRGDFDTGVMAAAMTGARTATEQAS